MQSVPITTNVVSSHLAQAMRTTLCDKVCRLPVCQGTPVSSTNKTETLLKVALNTINQTLTCMYFYKYILTQLW